MSLIINIVTITELIESEWNLKDVNIEFASNDKQFIAKIKSFWFNLNKHYFFGIEIKKGIAVWVEIKLEHRPGIIELIEKCIQTDSLTAIEYASIFIKTNQLNGLIKRD